MDNAIISLEVFSRAYVSEALELAKNRVSLEEFYRGLTAKLSSQYDISKELTLYLSHPFHWHFFCEGDGSPFEYIQGGERDAEGCSHSMVKLRNGIECDAQKIADEILSKYKVYLDLRFKSRVTL